MISIIRFKVLEFRTAFLYLNVGVNKRKEIHETFAHLEGCNN